MADDTTDIEKQLIASDKRFEIYVPKPKSRINVGTTARKKDPDGPWGHKGITIATAENVVVSAAKDMVQQSGGNTNFLVGGALGHYTKGDVNLTSGADMRVAAAQRLLIMSGANNAPGAQALTGDSLRLQAYNHLAQHYRIDALNVGLFEFFHGRRERPIRVKKAFGATRPTRKLTKFSHEKTVRPLAKHSDLQGGFAENALRTLDLLYPAEREAGDAGELFYPRAKAFYPKTRKKAQSLITIPPRVHPPTGTTIPPIQKIKDSSDPRYWIEDLFADDPAEAGMKKAPPSTVFGTDEIDQLKHGFSRYYDRFDPYPIINVSAFPRPAQKALAVMRNTLTRMHRIFDCLVYVSTLPAMGPQLLIQLMGSAPIAGQLIGALDGGMAAYGVVADRVDYYSKVEDASEVPAAANVLAFGEPFKANADARKASIASGPGNWNLSKGGPWRIEVRTQDGIVASRAIDLGPVPARPAVLTIQASDLDMIENADGDPIGVEEVRLRLEIDGHEFTITLDHWNAPRPEVAREVIESAVSSVATVTESDDVITITTRSVGADSRITIVDCDSNRAGMYLYTAIPGTLAQGRGIIPAIADPRNVTVRDIAARLEPAPPAAISVVEGMIRITSDKEGDGSRIVVSGNLADKVFGATKEDHVVAKISPDWESVDSAGSLTEPLSTWMTYVKGLPDQVASVFQPLTDAAADLLSVMEGLEAAAEAIAATDLLLPPPPEAVGIFGTQGITLGTHDRIVGSGSHGILFVVDGGSGEPDKGKQQLQAIKLERFANLMGQFGPPLRKKKTQSLGFRVYSDSVVDLNAGHGVQLLAMGRAKSTAQRPDGKLTGGSGVARVLSSFATEVAGYEKVVISARSAGDPADTEAKTGGRVELAGQTIAIGGVRIEEQDSAGNPYGPFDFEHPDGLDAHANMGIAPFDAEYAALSEHLHLSAKNVPPKIADGWNKEPTYLKRMAKWAWPEQLRKEHPPTQRVHVHSSKEAVIVVGPYMIHVTQDAGVSVGTRKAEKDPASNELDDTKPSFVLDDQGVRLVTPNDGKQDHTTLALELGTAELAATDGSGKIGSVALAEGSAKIGAGDDDAIEITPSSGVKVAASKIDLTGSGTIRIKSNAQIQIG